MGVVLLGAAGLAPRRADPPLRGLVLELPIALRCVLHAVQDELAQLEELRGVPRHR